MGNFSKNIIAPAWIPRRGFLSPKMEEAQSSLFWVY